MDTIRELYYGNVHPFERDIKKDSESGRLAKLVLRHDAAGIVQLSWKLSSR